MTFGGNTDNQINRVRIRKALMKVGKCVYCPPNGGENESHDKHSKGKETK